MFPDESFSWPATSITQDAKGNMWLTTNGELIRFNSDSTTYYSTGNSSSTSLAGPGLECVYADKNGFIWIGMFGTGLDRLDPSTGIIKHYRNNPKDSNSISSDLVTCIYEDKAGNFWVGTHSGLNKLDKTTGKFTHYVHNDKDPGSLSNNQVRVIYQDREGTLWIGTGSPWEEGVEGGLNKMDMRSGKFTRYMHSDNDNTTLINNKVRALFEDKAGNFWVGTAGDGLHLMNRKTGKFQRLTYDAKHPEKLSRSPLYNNLPPSHITFITQDISGVIWIGEFDGGLTRYDEQTKQVQHFNEVNNTNKFNGINEGVFGHCISKDGLLWITTFIGNVYAIIPAGVTLSHAYSLNMLPPSKQKSYAYKKAVADSLKYLQSLRLCRLYYEDNPDSALKYGQQALSIARENNRKTNESYCLAQVGGSLAKMGRYAESFETYQQALKIAEDPKNENSAWKTDPFLPRFSYHENSIANLGWIHLSIAFHIDYLDSTDEQIFHFKKALQLSEEVKDTLLKGFASWGLAQYTHTIGKLDSALMLLDTAEQIFQNYDIQKFLSYVYLNKAEIYLAKGDKDTQLYYLHKSLEALQGTNNTYASNWAYEQLINYYLNEKQKDSSLYYARKDVAFLLSRGWKDMSFPYYALSKSYELWNEIDSAYKYQGLAIIAVDSTDMAYAKNVSTFQKQSFKDQIRLKNLEEEKASYQSKIRTNVLLGGLFTLVVIAFFLFRNNRQKQKANILIAQQKEKVESTLTQLQSTQAQLIQSEKMASLGELTAGIAHEIQNPLNFVNNFSEVSDELIGELVDEVDKGNTKEVKAIAENIKQNLEKINHHGKRADAIVKSMLQHSKQTKGIKEPTDINALFDEYLRLAYHGLRARDKNFNAEIKTDFDESIGKINIVPQDIGRVLLNLFNNAFYATNEKLKACSLQHEANYTPLVSVATRKLNSPLGDGRIEIIVEDNGNGIPPSIKEKIFQPFFTTKPTGEGTGLGLSLSYDIIKAHGGEIKVDTKADVASPGLSGKGNPDNFGKGEGTTFIIQLPLTKTS
ncbi:MAG TPA: two-component regulator propeller domain-containing protein [Parafilimonas sp.]|nr:two-component regulator propeller domain-containing protein [Parafilimonas sp.]